MIAGHFFVIGGGRAATPDDDESMSGDDAPNPDLPVPGETPDVKTEPAGHGSGRSRARRQAL